MHLPTITPSSGTTPDHDGSRRQFMVSAAGAALLPLASPAQAAVTLEGVTLDETIMVGSRKLVLNGAGVRRRGYFKADVTALYLPEKRTTPESIFKLDGYRRIQLNILRDFTSSTISRIFISDFKQAATEEEFKKLIEVISLVGGAYSNVKRVTKGDVVDLDWVPGKGWMAFMNGKALQVEGAGADAINNELAYQVYLRMYIGASAPEDLRNGLLGLTKLNKV
jgi:Chalcone isomerase-like